MMKSYICADLGGSRIKLGLFKDGSLLAKSTFEVEDTDNNEHWLGLLSDQIEQILITGQKISGISLAYAGPVNCKEKRLLPSNGKYRNAHKLDLIKWASRWSDYLILDNDARLACAGEWQYGAGQGYANLVCVTLGTGIGTSVVIGGRLLRGAHDLAGCLGGHLTISQEPLICSCGNTGCVEALASTDRLAELQARFLKPQQYVQQFSEIFQHSKQGEQEFQELERFLLKAWGSAMVNYIHAYDPEALIISGGLMADCGDYILEKLAEYIDRYTWAIDHKVVLKKGFAEKAALYGGHYLLEHGEANVTI